MKTKRFLALFLCLMMLAGLLPAGALAEEFAPEEVFSALPEEAVFEEAPPAADEPEPAAAEEPAYEAEPAFIPEEPLPLFTVTFDLRGLGEWIAPAVVPCGSLLEKPEDPWAEGYAFLGWYYDEACTWPWDFDADTVWADLTLYACWEEAFVFEALPEEELVLVPEEEPELPPELLTELDAGPALQELTEQAAFLYSDGYFEYIIVEGGAVIQGYTGPGGEVVIPAAVKEDDKTYTVTDIGTEAFRDNTSITGVTFDEGSQVKYIGYSAFWGCTGLTNITIPNSVTTIGKAAFRDCTSLTSMTIPEGVERILDYTFKDCGSLTSVTIPDSVKTIERGAFEGCTGLKYVMIGNGVESIDHKIFNDCSNRLKVYFRGTMQQMYNLAGVYPENIMYLSSITASVSPGDVGTVTFTVIPAAHGTATDTGITCYTSDKVSLTAVPKTEDGYRFSYWMWKENGADKSSTVNPYTFLVKKGIDGYENIAFTAVFEVDPAPGFTIEYHEDLTATVTGYTGPGGEVSIPAAVTKEGKTYAVTAIGNEAFKENTAITGVTIPNSVTEIGEGAFDGCRGLTYVYVPEAPDLSGASIDTGAHILRYSISGDEAAITGYSGPGGNVTIPSTLGGNNVTTIGDGAFLNNTAIKGINICQAAAVVERTILDGRHTVRDRDFCEAVAAEERLVPDGLHAARDRDFRETGAVVERIVPDGRHAVRDRDTREAGAAGERTRHDGRHARRDRHFLEAAAAGERIYPDDRHAGRDRDFLEAAAVVERIVPDGRHAVRDRDTAEFFA